MFGRSTMGIGHDDARDIASFNGSVRGEVTDPYAPQSPR